MSYEQISSTLLLPLQDDSSFSSPTLSFAESFATAYSSPSQAGSDTSPSLLPSSALVPAQPLRKSISVDSFVQFSRDPHSVAGSSSIRGTVASELSRNISNASPPAPKTEREFWPARDRGSSFSSARDGDESVVDSDVERSDPSNSPVDRYRHTSLKGQDQSKSFIRGGDLSLPSRSTSSHTPTLSSMSSTSSMVSNSTNSSTLEDVPRQQSLSSLQSLPGRSAPLPSVIPGRIRSGSLGMYANPSSRRMLINTSVGRSLLVSIFVN